MRRKSWGFTLMVMTDALSLQYGDGYTFARVSLVTPSSVSYDTWVSWTAPSLPGLRKLPMRSPAPADLYISWCADFPLEECLAFIQPRQVLPKDDNGYTSDTYLYLHT